jgi:hypothetical protein
MEKCPHCYKEIDGRATRCNHCGGEMENAIDAYARKHGSKAAVKQMFTTLAMGIVLGVGGIYWWIGDFASALVFGAPLGFVIGMMGAVGSKKKKPRRA